MPRHPASGARRPRTFKLRKDERLVVKIGGNHYTIRPKPRSKLWESTVFLHGKKVRTDLWESKLKAFKYALQRARFQGGVTPHKANRIMTKAVNEGLL